MAEKCFNHSHIWTLCPVIIHQIRELQSVQLAMSTSPGIFSLFRDVISMPLNLSGLQAESAMVSCRHEQNKQSFSEILANLCMQIDFVAERLAAGVFFNANVVLGDQVSSSNTVYGCRLLLCQHDFMCTSIFWRFLHSKQMPRSLQYRIMAYSNSQNVSMGFAKSSSFGSA